jgi:cell wall-associated NlpC family hydrolase
MIEQSRLPMPSRDPGDLDFLQQRAQRRRQSHSRHSRSLPAQWQQALISLGAPSRSLTRLPARFLLHAVVALVLPIAVLLSQFQVAAPVPASLPAAPADNSDIVAPVAPLNLDAQAVEGDAPLDDNGDIPVPLSLVSRTEALAPVIVAATIAGDRINLRNGPGTEYDAVSRISAGAPVPVIGRTLDGTWFEIRERAGKPTVWVSAELLQMPDGAADTLFEIGADQIPPPPPPKVATVRETGLQLRDGPGTNYISMSKLQAGNQLELLERYQDWFHVGIPGGTDGWVKGEFLQIETGITDRLLDAETIPDPNPSLVGLISENAVNLRKGPDSKYTKVGGVDAGAKVDLIGKYKDWFQIKLGDGTKAWIFSDFLNVTERVIRRVPVSKDFPALPSLAKARTASGSSSRSSASANLANIPVSGDVASYAMNFVGSRYVYGGASPSRGFDCSGLTSYVYAKHGVSLPHSAAGQFNTRYGASVGSMDNLKPGDLVFFAGTAGNKRGISHVGIYIGGGRMVNAMTPRYGVQVSNIYESYWVKHYYGAIRPNR